MNDPIFLAVTIYLALVNALALFMTAFDKYRAVTGGWRVKERTLITLAAIGGSLGELIAMLVTWHKIRKPKFYLLVPLFLLAHVFIFWNFYGFYF